MTRAKAYLFGGVEIRWCCDPRARQGATCPPRRASTSPAACATSSPAASKASRALSTTSLPAIPASRAATAPSNGPSPGPSPTASSTPTATPFQPPKAARTSRACAPPCSAASNYAELNGNKRAAILTAEDVLVRARRCFRCSCASPNSSARPRTAFLARSDPHRRHCPQGRLRPLAAASPNQANKLLDWAVERAEERLRRQARKRKSTAQSADAQAPPAGQARRLHAVGGTGRRDLHRRRRLAPAAAPSRRATAPARPSCRCAARC